MKVQITCDMCGDHWLVENPHKNESGEYECPLCSFDWNVREDICLEEADDYFYCRHCDQYHHISDMIGDDDPICMNCYQLQHCGVSAMRINKKRQRSKKK